MIYKNYFIFFFVLVNSKNRIYKKEDVIKKKRIYKKREKIISSKITNTYK